jgi:hypothetical protein
MTDRAFVIGVSGVPDAGKTTLIRFLLGICKVARPVYHDRHQTITDMTNAQIESWFARSADPNEFPLSQLIAKLERETQIRPEDRCRPVVLFETPFGRLHQGTGAFIDFLVWIDTPFDVVVSRAILASLDRARRNAASETAADILKWQRDYLLNYALFRPMYLSQREKISAAADLVLDGMGKIEEMAAVVCKFLAVRGIET